ncbi:MAG: alpha/beta fold hydrolase, partial [Alphaproteobacteria bacterium]|nr:alpha/beta fold hydrolase [Alphaproteobacteria bacterium]
MPRPRHVRALAHRAGAARGLRSRVHGRARCRLRPVQGRLAEGDRGVSLPLPSGERASVAPLRTALVDGLTLAFREAGAGPALVLLHGIGGSSETWANQLMGLGGRFRVIAWDAPGYGGSDALAAATPGPDDYARALARLLDDRAVARAHIVGQSAGAPIAAAFCRLYAARAASFTFCQGLVGLAGLDPAERDAAVRARLDPFAALGP